MLNENEQFAKEVLACLEELQRLLPQLTDRYERLVVVAALAQHVGGALKLILDRQICSPEQARNVLGHLESVAFDTPAAPPSSQHPAH